LVISIAILLGFGLVNGPSETEAPQRGSGGPTGVKVGIGVFDGVKDGVKVKVGVNVFV
jgi:hypothetical protein